jgi:alpha-tubulin suppressor-like RCC1 family protein
MEQLHHQQQCPVDVVGLSSGVLAVSAGVEHACAITSDGRILCWGHNTYGQLGDGTQTSSLVPVSVKNL